MIRSTMQRVPLSSNTLLERAGKIYPQSEVVSRMPDKSLHRYRFADFYRRSRQLASALLAAGLKKGDRVATLSWNHYAHFECYFGIPAAGGVTAHAEPAARARKRSRGSPITRRIASSSSTTACCRCSRSSRIR